MGWPIGLGIERGLKWVCSGAVSFLGSLSRARKKPITVGRIGGSTGLSGKHRRGGELFTSAVTMCACALELFLRGAGEVVRKSTFIREIRRNPMSTRQNTEPM